MCISIREFGINPNGGKFKKEPRCLRRDFEKQKTRSGASAGSQGGKIHISGSPDRG